MEEKTTITKYNPIDMISNLLKQTQPQLKDYEGTIQVQHIIYDKDVVPEYNLIRSSTHDGTMMFTHQLMCEAVECLVNRTTCYVKTQPKYPSTIKDMKYIIGDIELKTEYGIKDLNCGRYPGVTDTITIPVRCEYTFK
jgi:hypothetical protein